MDLKKTSPRSRQPSPKRSFSKLSAIMFTDIKGFSRKMGESETLTLKLLRDHNRIVRFLARKHRGRIVKGTGDGYLLDFDSAVEAVRCAMEAQERFLRYNSNKPDADQILVRMSISLGEVRVLGGDLFGDEVNIAARLQGLAEPGGICITREVYDRVKSKLQIVAVNLGLQELKNICNKVEVFKILIRELGNAAIEITQNEQGSNQNDEELEVTVVEQSSAVATAREIITAPAANMKTMGRRMRRRTIPLITFAVLLPTLLFLPRFIHELFPALSSSEKQYTAQAGIVSFNYDHSPTLDKTLAVTFFDNKTKISSDDWLCVGLADMLVTDIQQAGHLNVLGRPLFQEALKTLGKTKTTNINFELARTASQNMHADLMLLGSIVRAGKSLRIDIQLYDVEKGKLLLAHKVNGQSVIQMVDELTRRLNAEIIVIARS